MVQVRAVDEGLVLQQLLYADEVRSMRDLHVENAEVQPAELTLAEQLIEQNSVDGYDPTAYKDEEKDRILAAIDKKIAGKKITVSEAARVKIVVASVMQPTAVFLLSLTPWPPPSPVQG